MTAAIATATTATTSEDAAAQDNIMFIEKYRPKSLDEMISHTDILSTITTLIDSNKLPHLLFYGPPGTGKTTAIQAISRKIFGKSYAKQILELNASDERGIDVVRNQIKTFASTQSIYSNSAFKIIVLDEADNMTQVAQNALRRIIEKYSKNVRFCLICNYVNKIIPAIQSRCTKFRFAPLKDKGRVAYIAQMEHINITAEGRDALLELSNGDMRKILNILQSTHAAFKSVTLDNVYKCTGCPHPNDVKIILDALLTKDFQAAFKVIENLKRDRGIALADLVGCVFRLFAKLDVPPTVRIYVLLGLGEIEANLAQGSNERIQLSAFVGVFKCGLELA